jgi:peptidylprolyl isomerase
MEKLSHLRSRVALLAATTLLLVFGLAGCSDSSNSSSKTPATANTITGVTATGESGKQPKVTFASKITVPNGSTETLIKGTGEKIVAGNQICVRALIYDAGTKKQLASTWTTATPDCSIILNSQASPTYVKLLTDSPLGSTFAMGVQDTSSSTTSASNPSYLFVFTTLSQNKVLAKATGTKVTNIPSKLPKVTLAAHGAPSIDLKNFKDPNPGKLTTQVLIKGKGAKVASNGSVMVQYTGWLTNGKKFDSSWDKNTPASFQLSQVVKGWGQGLANQTVGSQVLLIIPPSLGYGSTASGSIPANSTLIFVVDILATY